MVTPAFGTDTGEREDSLTLVGVSAAGKADAEMLGGTDAVRFGLGVGMSGAGAAGCLAIGVGVGAAAGCGSGAGRDSGALFRPVMGMVGSPGGDEAACGAAGPSLAVGAVGRRWVEVATLTSCGVT